MTKRMELTQTQQQVIVDALLVAASKYRQNAKDSETVFNEHDAPKMKAQFSLQADEADLMVAIIAQADEIVLKRYHDLFQEVPA